MNDNQNEQPDTVGEKLKIEHGPGSKSAELTEPGGAASILPDIGEHSYGSGERYGGRDSGKGLVPNNTEQENTINDREEKALGSA